MHLIEPAKSIHVNWPLEGSDRPKKLRQLHNGIEGKVVHPKSQSGQNLRESKVQRKPQPSSEEVPKHHALTLARVWRDLILRCTANPEPKIPFLLVTPNQLWGHPRLTENESRRRLLAGTHQFRRICHHVRQILLPLR